MRFHARIRRRLSLDARVRLRERSASIGFDRLYRDLTLPAGRLAGRVQIIVDDRAIYPLRCVQIFIAYAV